MSLAVSVALCTHNGRRFVAGQIQSILTQTTPVSEIVVSDDASTDGTIEIVEEMLAAYPDAARRDVIIRNPVPLGVTANFEQAISACSGELIALSDQDDVWHPERIARAAVVFEDPAVLAVHSDARLVDAAGDPLGVSLLEALEVSDADLRRIADGDAVSAFIRRNLATGATMMIRARLMDIARPFPPAWVHDEWLAMIAALRGGLRLDRAQLIDYRQHGANEIGVSAPTLRHKVRRVLRPRGDRNRLLAERAAQLEARAFSLDGATQAALDLVAEKARFESARANLPHARVRRVVPVLRLSRGGRYDRLSSRGRADVIRDILQPVAER